MDAIMADTEIHCSFNDFPQDFKEFKGRLYGKNFGVAWDPRLWDYYACGFLRLWQYTFSRILLAGFGKFYANEELHEKRIWAILKGGLVAP